MSTLRTDNIQTTDSSVNIPVVDLATKDYTDQIRTDLATTTGASLVGYKDLTVQSRLDQLLSVKVSPFSAVGDGVANDTPAFQAANDSFTNGTSGFIYVPIGTYKLDSNVVANGRTVTFLCAAGALFTGAGSLNVNYVIYDASGAIYGPGRHAFGSNVAGGGVLIGGGVADEGNQGVYLSSDGHANWLRTQTSLNYNPTENVIYGAAGQGRAISVVGGGFIDRTEGTLFDADWVGKPFFFNYKEYKVGAFVSVNRLQLTESNGAAVVFGVAAISAFHFVLTSGVGTCSVVGTTVTRLSGQPFVPFISTPGYVLTINGTPRAVASWVSGDVMTLSSAPGDVASAAYRYELNINSQISTLRIQKMFGSTEENLTISAKAYGEYECRVGQSGNGEYYPLKFYNGIISAFNPKPVAQVSVAGRFGVSNNPTFIPAAILHSSSDRVESIASGLYNEATRISTQWSDGERSVEIGNFSNGTQGGYLQGRDSVNNPYDVCLNPRGGNIGVGLNNPVMKLTVAGVVGPGTDNLYSLGQSGARWSVVWAATGTINTSDERTKTDIKDSALGLDFIERLEPKSFKFKVGGRQTEEVEDGFDEVLVQGTEVVEKLVEYTEVEVINGRKTLVTKTRTEYVEQSLFDTVDDLYNEDGVLMPPTAVPRMVVRKIPKTKLVTTDVVGKRDHFGFLAQQVKSVLDSPEYASIDFAGYIEGEDGVLGLRYEQLFSPLVKAVQELSARVKELENK